MRAEVLFPRLTTTYGRFYCAPRRLHRYNNSSSSSQFLKLNLSRFSGGLCLLTAFFHMESQRCLLKVVSAVILCLFVSAEIYSSSDDDDDDATDSICLETMEFYSIWPEPEQYHSGTGSSGKKAMVETLERFGVISSKRVGYNATISAPHMHATCLQLLEDKLQPGMRALDVGSGTGYLTGCFALMVGDEGRVVGVDHIPELVDMSIKNIENSVAASLLKKGSLSLHVGDGRKGWQEFAPYDAIHVGAAASKIPQPLLDQLKPGGRMVIPLGTYLQELKVIDKSEDGSIKVHTETSVRYVPLTSRDEQLGGF
ncbi:Protein-L-isoaspartate O-methyltransferase 2 [Cardamine amara subsp. amara]|uniref:Protein-L-isoaspartate O-methyltransferase n=1 Tax=Cardamine amara subsp. amara TaxID=228776 RepID=A0ABD1BD45_CARAN